MESKLMILTYSITNDITSQLIDPGSLFYEIDISGYSVSGVTTRMDIVSIGFDSELIQDDIDIVDTIVLNHSGIPAMKFKFFASSPIIQTEVSITQNIEWQILGGLYVEPSFFIDDLTKAISTIDGESKHQGNTFEIRLVEVDQYGTRKVITMPCDHGMDITADWHKFGMMSVMPPVFGKNLYQLEGRLNDSPSAVVRFCNIVLLEICP